MSDVFQIAIVGGGVAGLVAACTAAKAGAETILFEAAADLGGRARTRAERGFSFNQGPHALYAKGAFRAALDALDVSFAGKPPDLSGAQALWGEARHNLPTSLLSFVGLTPLEVRERLQLATTFARVARGDYDASGRSLRAWTASLRPRVAALVETMVRLATYAHAPESLEAEAALDQLRLGFSGVVYVDGGWGEIVRGLAARALQLGVRVERAARIAELARDGSLWRVALPDGRIVAAKAAILAVEPRECARLASFSARLAAAAAATRPIRAVCLDVALSRLPRPRATFAMGVDEPWYFSVHSQAARLAPPGGALIHAARYLTSEEAPTPAIVDGLERRIDRQLPGWREREVARQRLVGMTVAHDFPRFDNDGRRAPIMVDDAPGLFLAGDWVGERGMLSDASAASGEAAAKAAARFAGAA